MKKILITAALNLFLKWLKTQAKSTSITLVWNSSTSMLGFNNNGSGASYPITDVASLRTAFNVIVSRLK
jgi:hypothetical protein